MSGVRLEMWTDTNSIIDDYRIRHIPIGRIAAEHHHSIRCVGALLRSLRLTRSHSEASKLAWTPKRRAEQGRVNRAVLQGVPRPTKTRCEGAPHIHKLAAWFQYAKERLDRYPNGEQAVAIIELMRAWNGGAIKHKAKEVAM